MDTLSPPGVFSVFSGAVSPTTVTVAPSGTAHSSVTDVSGVFTIAYLDFPSFACV